MGILQNILIGILFSFFVFYIIIITKKSIVSIFKNKQKSRKTNDENYKILVKLWKLYIKEPIYEWRNGKEILNQFGELFDEHYIRLLIDKDNSTWYHKYDNMNNIKTIISNHYKDGYPELNLFGDPIILFIYYLSIYYPDVLEKNWKYGNEYLKIIFTDIGGYYYE